MDRRGFLKMFAAAVAAPKVVEAVLDPERALWIPGQKLISIPAPVEIVSEDEFLTEEMIVNEILQILRNQLKFSRLINSDYSQEFDSFKVGHHITIRRPSSFRV